LNLKKNRFVCDLWLSVHMKSVVEQAFLHKFAFNKTTTKCLKHSSNFESVENVRSSNQIRTSSHL